MSRTQFKQLAELKDSTSFPFSFTQDDIVAEVMSALVMANAYDKPPGLYRYNYSSENHFWLSKTLYLPVWRRIFG